MTTPLILKLQAALAGEKITGVRVMTLIEFKRLAIAFRAGNKPDGKRTHQHRVTTGS